jgi:hypothetical protein
MPVVQFTRAIMPTYINATDGKPMNAEHNDVIRMTEENLRAPVPATAARSDRG